MMPLRLKNTSITATTKARFFNIGVAFPAKKGNGFDLIVASGISVTGRVSIRERKGQPGAGADADEIPY